MKRLVVGSIVPILALLVSIAGTSPASAQTTGNLGIWAYNCETDPSGNPTEWLDTPPRGCEVAAGATFMATDADGEVLDDCTIASGESFCLVEAALGITVTVTEDATAIPSGYTARENPIVYDMPPPGSDGQFSVAFVNVRQAADDEPDDGATTLPTTGVGTTAGSDRVDDRCPIWSSWLNAELGDEEANDVGE